MSSRKYMENDHPGERSPLIDPEDDWSTGCRNVSHYKQQRVQFMDYAHPDDLASPTYKLFFYWMSLLYVYCTCIL